jgi:pyruvate,water dikinase
MSKYIRWFEEVSMDDVSLVGGKNASLGELIGKMSSSGIRVPNGFCVTAEAYSFVLKEGGVQEKLANALSTIDTKNVDDLAKKGRIARALIKQNGIPPKLAEQIIAAYRQLAKEYGEEPDVAVRSSATAEDLPDASFAGQQESFLNIRGETELLDACLNCFASLFTDRAISYRVDKNFDHMQVKLSIAVQKMVRSDRASAGVIFTLDTESGFRDVVLVTSAYGLGENVVAGRVDPDEFIVFKPTLEKGFKPIVRRKVGEKQVQMIYSGHGTRTTRNIDVSPERQERFSISDQEVLQLATWACEIERYYSERLKRPTAMDIEWAKDGVDGQLYIVQARPETVHSGKTRRTLETFRLDRKGEVILKGRSIGEKIGAGAARVINSVHELNEFKDGEVLVADMTDPDWEPIMKRASGIVTNRGGRTCHAAIVSREIGVPCVVGTHEGTELIKQGQNITVSCAEGDTGIIYDGKLSFQRQEIDLESLPPTTTQIMVNVGNPDQAFTLAQLPVAGVGLAREEFIIANDVKVHPLALTRFDQITDLDTKRKILDLTKRYGSKCAYFVEKLAEGVATIAAAFYPKPVIVRLSDFKTNEYANLLGGQQFEPKEDNPMIGFRGASRYYSKNYSDGFALECKAIKMVREEMGLRNVKVMIPFCRTVSEGKKVLAEMEKNGLSQGKDDLEVYVMCELPSNVLDMEHFAEIFDGFSIGSNDLTQLILGVDRDNEGLSDIFDERNPAVMKAIETAIATAKAFNRKIGICGQAPSDYPEFARFLVQLNIDSISLNEDAVIKTILLIAREEAQNNGQANSKSGSKKLAAKA